MTKYYIDGPYRCIHCFQLSNQISERSYCNDCEYENNYPKTTQITIDNQLEESAAIRNIIIETIGRIMKLLRID